MESHDRYRATDSYASFRATLIAIIAFLPIYMSPTPQASTRATFHRTCRFLLLLWILALIHVPLMADRWLHPAIDTDSTGKRVYKGKICAGLRWHCGSVWPTGGVLYSP